MATISKISKRLAKAINTSSFFKYHFFEKAKENEYIELCHYNFFYSFPEFGKKWNNGNDCEFHKVETKCSCCSKTPERNFAGIGTIYIVKRDFFTLLCRSCLGNSIEFERKRQKAIQMSLF